MGTGRRVAGVALVVCLTVLPACDTDERPTGDASAAPGDVGAHVEGGTVIVAADRQPTTLNATAPDGRTPVNELIWSSVLSPLWRITPGHGYEPLLLDGEPETSQDPFTVTYTLRDGLQWSDGEPITVHDVVFTHDTIVAEGLPVVSRAGHRLVRATTVVSDRQVRFEFRRPFAGWRAMFSEPGSAILPKHLLEGRDPATTWTEQLTAASGPFEFDTWQRGQQLVLKRNENYWGQRAHLDEVIITFHPDAQAQIDMLRNGDADVVAPAAAPEQIAELAALPMVETDIRPGLRWEYIDFNVAVPPTDKIFIRTAIARAIDRDTIIASVAGDAGVPALNNVLVLADQPAYADHWSSLIGHDPAAAEDLLVRNGCTKPNEVYVCDGEPLVLEYLSTADVSGRIDQFDLVREDLAAVGIRLTPRFVGSDELRELDLNTDSSWDLLSYARSGSPNIWDSAAAWRCEGRRAMAVSQYCNAAADGLLGAAGRILDREQRSRLWNEADAVIARDVPTIPLFQQPTVLAWNSRIEGPANNPTAWGPLWNVGDWRLTQ